MMEQMDDEAFFFILHPRFFVRKIYTYPPKWVCHDGLRHFHWISIGFAPAPSLIKLLHAQ